MTSTSTSTSTSCALCGACGDDSGSLLRCSRCKSARYCNASCQRAHWPSHKLSCRAPAASSSSSSSRAPSLPFAAVATVRTIASYAHTAELRSSWRRLYEPEHRLLSLAEVAVRDLGARGLGIVAGRSFAEGETIFIEEPFVSMPDAGLLGEAHPRYCGKCRMPYPFVQYPEMKLREKVPCTYAPRCDEIYCSTECRESAHRYGHSLVCRGVLSAAANDAYHQLRRQCVRESRINPLLCVLLISKLVATRDEIPSGWERVSSIYSPLLEDISEQLRSEFELVREIFAECAAASDYLSLQLYVQLLVALRMNNIRFETVRVALAQKGLSYAECEQRALSVTGAAFFLAASYMNHSCDSTVTVERQCGHTSKFIARKRLAPGDELTIDYIGSANLLPPSDTTDPEEALMERLLHRQQQVLSNYQFRCQCSLCESEFAAIEGLD